VFKRVRVLSGGEKSRLALVKLLLDPPNLLLLDEPTTHLDISSTEVLLAALEEFTGTIVLISHDVFFIRHLANHVVQVRDGQLRAYPGGYDYYVDATASLALLASSGPSTPTIRRPSHPTPDRRESRRMEAERRQIAARERRVLQDRVDELEREIHAIEARQTALTRDLQDPATYAAPGKALEIQVEFRDNRVRLDQLTRQWEGAATSLAGLDPR
jgi:ATP-binding cassette subfamily F protein 3